MSLPIREASYRSLSQSSVSTFSTSRGVQDMLKKEKWQSSWQFVTVMIGYSMTSYSFSAFIRTGKENQPNFVQHMLGYLFFLFFGMPIMYMQIVLGQYTTMGMFNLRYCIPLSRGLPYSFMVSVFLETLLTGYFMTDELMYFLLSFQTVLPWTVCPKYQNISCLNGKSNKTGLHTAFAFWKYIYMENPVVNQEDITTYEMPSKERIVILLATWAMTFGIMCVSNYRYRKYILYMVSICSAGFLIVFFAILTRHASTGGVTKLLSINVDEFYSINAWKNTVGNVISGLALGELYNMYAGALLPSNQQAGTLSVVCGCVLWIYKMILSSMCMMCEALIIDETKVPSLDVHSNVAEATLALHVTTPQGLSYLSLYHLWNSIYFGCHVIISVSNQILHLMSMQAAVTDMYPNFYKFRMYVFGVICVLCCFSGLCLLPSSVFAIAQVLFTEVMVYIKFCSVLMLTITIFWVYGVTNLSDDIHYLMGSQPTKYWKICWYITPLIMIIVMVIMIIRAISRPQLFFMLSAGAGVIFLSPAAFYLGIEVLGHIKQRNLLGTIRPTEQWGPPDPDDRALRRMFNPRLATKYQAHKMVCEHCCLYGNKALKNIINQEDLVRREYLMNLVETKRVKVFFADVDL
ncbi:Sodium:neurotransmitter symporter family [Popillia japonica]|uniref:Sodium:neurotransmitter symporter family n=1 Tax=Popillia japonica TaxID=7064 RepID=A0AAW1IYA2_POPJA